MTLRLKLAGSPLGILLSELGRLPSAEPFTACVSALDSDGDGELLATQVEAQIAEGFAALPLSGMVSVWDYCSKVKRFDLINAMDFLPGFAVCMAGEFPSLVTSGATMLDSLIEPLITRAELERCSLLIPAPMDWGGEEGREGDLLVTTYLRGHSGMAVQMDWVPDGHWVRKLPNWVAKPAVTVSSIDGELTDGHVEAASYAAAVEIRQCRAIWLQGPRGLVDVSDTPVVMALPEGDPSKASQRLYWPNFVNAEVVSQTIHSFADGTDAEMDEPAMKRFARRLDRALRNATKDCVRAAIGKFVEEGLRAAGVRLGDTSSFELAVKGDVDGSVEVRIISKPKLSPAMTAAFTG